MSTPVGNARLRAARQALGIRSQAALADAVSAAARSIGLRIALNPRTVRRWESASPPWPHPEHARALEALFQRPVVELGFTPPWTDDGTDMSAATPQSGGPRLRTFLGAPGSDLPHAAATDYAAISACHRRLYWTVPAPLLHRSVADHAELGAGLISQTPASHRALIAAAVSESSLLAGRLEFFDLQQPEIAHASLTLALRAAHEATDSLLGSAVLAHMAFVPAFSSDPSRADEARDKIRGAKVFARRGNAAPLYDSWLDAVDAEVETRLGDTSAALQLIRAAENRLVDTELEAASLPPWFDWFSAARLAGFKGSTLVAAGQGNAARKALEIALAGLPDDAAKQKSIILADLAATAVVENQPELACDYVDATLNQLNRVWYATAMDRVKAVRESLRRWESLPAVRALDDRLYDWHTALNALSD